MSKIVRAIKWYEKKSEIFVGEYIIPSIELSLLRTILKLEYSDPVYGCYPFTEEIKKKYSEIAFNLKFDFIKYDYFIESYEE